MKRRVLANRLLLIALAGAALVCEPGWRNHPALETGLQVSGLALLCLAAFGRAWSGLYITGNKNRALVVTGPYSLTRNPLYLFSLTGFAGAGLAFGSLAMTLLLCAAFFATHWPAILYEEKRLASQFGRAYTDYAATVPRLLPAWRMPHTPALVEINATLYTRALAEAASIPLVYPVARLIDWGHAQSLLPQLFRLY